MVAAQGPGSSAGRLRAVLGGRARPQSRHRRQARPDVGAWSAGKYDLGMAGAARQEESSEIGRHAVANVK
jgi:hypothetical protein